MTRGSPRPYRPRLRGGRKISPRARERRERFGSLKIQVDAAPSSMLADDADGFVDWSLHGARRRSFLPPARYCPCDSRSRNGFGDVELVSGA
ncbi:hypothetical protein [Aminivibrio sp.]|uniref:hypothetical protein n=1 Tax=Aminivibrio sp. TaxID=1872489 RepID=UPI003D956272